MNISLLSRPLWQTPDSIEARFSTREGGVSDPPFHSLNLATHAGDDPAAVGENRMRVRSDLPAAPRWLRQAHTNRVVCAEEISVDSTVADAAHTCSADVVCAVMTADCLPVLFCDAEGARVAAAHAGWRGLSAGVLENTVAALRESGGDNLLAWIGPAIGREHYEIGEDVRSALCRDKEDEMCLTPCADDKWLADLSRLALRRLSDLQVRATASDLCTYSEPRKFFSARRDGGQSGRTAALIWTTTGTETDNG